jgi:hypothetical protein
MLPSSASFDLHPAWLLTYQHKVLKCFRAPIHKIILGQNYVTPLSCMIVYAIDWS